ncbi:MAG TPA: methylisocitrate lyase, partial [Blastocatellia bacterium]
MPEVAMNGTSPNGLSKVPQDAASAFRTMLSNGEGLVAPGVFNAVTALLAEKQGFKVGYFSGGAFAVEMGLPDIGLFSLTELADAVRRITSVSTIPLVVDADTGFGEPVNVMRTVTELEAAGAAAVHLEDQAMPKRCGHLDGKQLISREAMLQKILAAKEARKGRIVIIARTDARSTLGMSAAIGRACAYLEAGADVIFPEALESLEEFREFAREVQAPLVANMTEFGKTPYIEAERFHKAGFKLVLFPQSAFRVALKAVADVYRELMTSGTQSNLIESMMTRREI